MTAMSDNELSAPIEPVHSSEDGRHQRALASREKIVKALIDLVRETNDLPGAKAIATRAGVGIRTVFRHFNDMETLYRKMAQQVDKQIMPLMTREYRAESWHERVSELIERRAYIYEQIEPFQTAIIAKRHRSEFLTFHYNNTVQREKKTLQQLLPAPVAQNRSVFAAMESAISFDTWQRLRHAHQFDTHQCIRCMQLNTNALIEQSNMASSSLATS